MDQAARRKRSVRPRVIAAAGVTVALIGGLSIGYSSLGRPRSVANTATATRHVNATSQGAQQQDRLRPLVLPDLTRVAESARAQIRSRHATLIELMANADSSPSELSAAYGDFGKLFMAANHSDAAETCLMNAYTLAPKDFRWVYYLGHLYRTAGKVSQSIEFFERAKQLQPQDVSTLVWLGDAYLSQGQQETAGAHYSQALALDQNSLSARFGLGRVALTQRNYAAAIEYLEGVLALDREAAAVHYPLSLAYRAIGESSKADAHLVLRRDHQILPADPLMVELEQLLESPQAYETRGIRALGSRDWDEAIGQFRRGLELAPEDPSLRHRLGTALFMAGDPRAAREEFERVLRTSPGFMRAHYSLGVMAAEEGRHQEAVARFSAAVAADERYVEARIGLATSLRGAGRPSESLPHYQQLFANSQYLSSAMFGFAMALIQLGRFQEAKDTLASGMKTFPERVDFAHALARVLAAAPVPAVRDGDEALVLMRQLVTNRRSIDVGETYAMALAETGHFDEAVKVQQELIASTSGAGVESVLRRLRANLHRYERHEACRTPWDEAQLP